jgi:serine phosphatase RsbU (regulator of sigma subunit)
MPDTSREARVRWGAAALFAVGFLVAAHTFYWNGSSSTDENLFTDTPSGVLVGGGDSEAQVGEFGASTVRPGDFLMGIHGTPVRDVAAVQAWGARTGDVPVQVRLRRPLSLSTLMVAVEPKTLTSLPLIDASDAVVVIAVTPGGASDRAGMKVGDVITRINGQTFTSALVADAIMRRGQAGRATAYDILREGRPMTLHVTLARFGFTVGAAAAFLSGIAWMVFGTFLAVARPGVPAASLLGYAILTFGFGLSVLFIRPFTEPTVISRVRDLAMGAAMLVGIALWGIDTLHFPRPHAMLQTRRWAVPLILWTAAAVGALAGIIALVSPGPRATAGLAFAALALLGAVNIATHGCRKSRPPDERRILGPIVWTGRLVGWTAASLGLLAGFGVLVIAPDVLSGMMALTLLAVPAAYAWTIGKHRVFDLDLRLRRTVQYSLASLAWGGLSMAALLAVLLTLPSLDLPLPNVRLRAGTIEVLDAPAAPSEQQWMERLVLMVGAIGLAFLFRRVGRDGQQWLATRFHRTEYDYKRASQDLSGLMGSRLDLDGLADGLVDTLVRLMPLDRAGVIFAHGTRTYCGRNAFGFEADVWDGCCVASCADVVRAVGDTRDQVSAEYVAPRLRDVLAQARVRYLYPIRHRDTLAGVLLIGDKRSEAAFRNADFEFLDAVARQVAPAVENAFLYEDLAEQERLRHELEIARRIQLESLPQFAPDIPGLDIAAASLPAFEVGGDYYDYLDGHAGHLTVIVGDVSGKGTSAALYMSKLQGILRSLHHFDLPLRDLLVQTNAVLCRDIERRSFVTALATAFDVHARRLTVARAGHLPLYCYARASGSVRRLLPKGLGLGLSNRSVFADELETETLTFAPGDVFLLISDGIVETQSAQGEEFGEDRVIGWLRETAGTARSALEVRDGLLEAARRFAGEAEQFDDQTVVVVRVT